jgi:peptidoglycan/LPS O-acetylase OafA/YrhL
MRNHILAAALQVPNVGTGTTPPFGDDLLTILKWIAWIATAACVLGILMVAATMAIRHQRGEGGQHLAGLGWVLLACILIGTASALVGSFA